MRAELAKSVLVPNQRYICLSCRKQSVGLRRERRYQHGGSSASGEAIPKSTEQSTGQEKKKISATQAPSRIRDIIRDFMFNNDASKEEKEKRDGYQDTPSFQVSSTKTVCIMFFSRDTVLIFAKGRSSKLEQRLEATEAKQKTLQQKFATQRRKQLLELHASESSKASREDKTLPVPAPDHPPDVSKSQRKQGTRREKRASRAATRALSKMQKIRPRIKGKSGKGEARGSRKNKEQLLSKSDPLSPVVRKVEGSGGIPVPLIKYGASESKPSEFYEKAEKSSNTAKQKKSADSQPTEGSNRSLQDEADKKTKLTEKLTPLVRKRASEMKSPFRTTMSGSPISEIADEKKIDGSSKSRKSSAKISDVAGFDSLRNAMGRKASKTQTIIEKADATKLNILRKRLPPDI